MRLSSFISSNLDLILTDWVAFARQQEPAAAGMDERALLNHGKLILQEVAADMQRPQDDVERQAKSGGNSVTASASRDVPSRSHARERARQGFEVAQMVAEYGACAASRQCAWLGNALLSRQVLVGICARPAPALGLWIDPDAKRDLCVYWKRVGAYCK